MNIVEKILARGSGKSSVAPDDVVFADVDKVMMHDVSGPGVLKVFDKLKKQGIPVDKLWDPTKVWVAEDHFVPSADKMSAENIVKLSNFTKQYGIEKHFKYGMGQYGICHTISHEEAMVMPGDVYVGGDSHTNTTGALGAFACGLGHTDIAYVLLNGNIWFKVPETYYFKLNGKLPDHVMAKDVILKIIGDIGNDGGAYRTMQFGGSGIDEMSVESRLTLCNMTTEAGAKNGIVEPDQKVVDYLSQRGASNFNLVTGDSDAEYSKIFEYESSEMEPMIAKPFSPDNTCVVGEAPSVELDKSYIGSCTGAKYEDLVSAAKILKGRKVKIRTEILPAAISIYQRAMENGLLKIFLDAGVTVGPPTCGACCGAHMGVLAKDEICISTTNRNFPGRMGHVESQTYLSSPMVAAASAVTGKITDPRDLL
ncbi:MAG: 3-isopropylmalate dehydratase large subunit [Nitrosopumilus sp.]|nr:3-isopropylmalate dehydratase large subunit [Nitrosopumilus sp.]MBT7933728.1 3-isopropylmalate dehydratase large subunit [Thiotrichales bacterium]MBT3685813.1 3-isopropylmalate dehydratase large subunit [Nitrosopumilus sp.]MBT3924374.1 3-isopropylmalate dehydratase large subunit [Nitrosopumilus sp.]MBT4216630.1 3-isopropylmalate dehydratase large subunit [Nitrosopumilus sp.]